MCSPEWFVAKRTGRKRGIRFRLICKVFQEGCRPLAVTERQSFPDGALRVRPRRSPTGARGDAGRNRFLHSLVYPVPVLHPASSAANVSPVVGLQRGSQ
jgi:hypothetical protein